jgi:hypothetical protein
VLSWHIAPGSQGFSPHRDRQPENVSASFSAKFPKYMTMWMLLNPVDWRSSSLFVVPAPADPGYYDGTVDEGDPLQMTFHHKSKYQTICNFQGKAGSAWLFSHRVMHWGSANYSAHPRISISFVCADPDFESPYLQTDNLTIGLRNALISGQMIVYYQRFDWTQTQLETFFRSFEKNRQHFHPDFVEKVVGELIVCLNEFEELDDDAEELLCELLLEGEDGQHDDFDELESDAKKLKTTE